MTKESINRLLSEAKIEKSENKHPYIHPQDSATLIIIDEREEPYVLMGRRAPQHEFMPNKFVFPGGRVDRGDTQVNPHQKLRTPIKRRLSKEVSSKMTAKRLQGLALAAIRETFEETGLIIGHKTTEKLTSGHQGWRDFFSYGVAPSLRNLDFIGRAITPPARTRRYDTRFFMVEAEEIYNNPQDIKGTGELLDIQWLPLSKAEDLDLPIITRKVLFDISERLQTPLPARYNLPAFFFYTHYRNAVMTELT